MHEGLWLDLNLLSEPELRFSRITEPTDLILAAHPTPMGIRYCQHSAAEQDLPMPFCIREKNQPQQI